MEHRKSARRPPAGDGVLSSTLQTPDPDDVTFTATIPGSYTLRLTTNDPIGACGPVSDDVVIVIAPGATADAGPAQAFCAGNSISFGGASIGGAASTGVWTIVSQPALPTPGDGTFSITTPVADPKTVTFTATVPGSYTLRLTTDDPAGNCPFVFDEVIITVYPVAKADAGSYQPICSGDVLTLSGATFGGGATGAALEHCEPACRTAGRRWCSEQHRADKHTEYCDL